MDRHFVQEFHRQRVQHGVVYVSNEGLRMMLRQELGPCDREEALAALGPMDLVKVLECDGGEGEFVRVLFSRRVGRKEIAFVLSLGKQEGPAICWRCCLMAQLAQSQPSRQFKAVG